jgi:soluble lytic murein transglycosylase
MSARLRKFLLVLALVAAPVFAGSDEDFLAAREAFRAGNALKLDQAAARLNGHALYPYIAYWQLRLRLGDADRSEFDEFIAAHADTPLAEQIAIDRLKLLGRRSEWQRLESQLKDFNQKPDLELRCYDAMARIKRKDIAALVEARELWLTAGEMPDSCNELFESLIDTGAIDKDAIWRRIRLALDAGNIGTAKAVMQLLPKSERIDTKLLNQVAARPSRYLDKPKLKLTTRTGREVWLFALSRSARSDLHGSVRDWVKMSRQFPDADRGFVWAQLATLAARRHDPAAVGWYVAAKNLTPEQQEWRVRASLRAQEWDKVLVAINDLPQVHQAYQTWTYWKARALKNLGKTSEAQRIFESLAGDFGFYGQLAAEEAGSKITLPPQVFKASEEQIKVMSARSAIQRSRAFYQLDLKFEGNREWAWAVRRMDDQELLTAAELARRLEFYDRAIYAADRTRNTHDFSLRYLTPFRDVMRPAATSLNLDEAWVYGLIRQESRFIASARSSAGAMGLMQIMPATAKWVAKQIGMHPFKPAQVGDIGTNIQLGSHYLKFVLQDLDEHPLLASAAYNAGPGRARQWASDKPLEGAIYAETIPFNETRDYVKKVMGNATWYAALLGGKIRSLKQRLGTISRSSFVSDEVIWVEDVMPKPRALPELDLEWEVLEAGSEEGAAPAESLPIME